MRVALLVPATRRPLAASIVAVPRLDPRRCDRPRRRPEPRRSSRRAAGGVYPDLAAILADGAVDTVVNLTCRSALRVAATALWPASTSTARSPWRSGSRRQGG